MGDEWKNIRPLVSTSLCLLHMICGIGPFALGGLSVKILMNGDHGH